MFFTLVDDWRTQAKCFGDDPTKWDAANLNPLYPEKEAELLCSGCPVRKQCRDDAENPTDTYRYTGVYEFGAELETVGVVRDGRVW